MALEKMTLVNIVGLMEELDVTLRKCCDSKCFHLEPAFSSSNNGRLALLNEKNPYATSLKGFSQNAAELGITLTETDYSKCELNEPTEFEALNAEIENKWLQLNAVRQASTKSISELEGAVLQIKHLKGLHSDFDKIFSCKYVSVRVGKLPVDNIPKLDYYEETFFFVPFETGRDFCWGMYFCPVGDKDIVDGIFKSMYFERMIIPNFVKGDTDEALLHLDEQIKEQKSILAKSDEEIKNLKATYENDIQQAFSKLRNLHDVFDLRRKVGALNGKFYLKGFIPQNEEGRFERLFEDCNTVSTAFMPPDADASCIPPTVLKNNRFTRPFGMLVEMYGLPSYNGFNPTAFVAVTYTLLFGIMFGDLGQGFLVFLLGLLVSKKMNKQMGGMVSRVGISSMVFGTLFGSVFGFEDLLDPIYEKLGIDFLPIKVFSQTNFILIAAVGIGIALILMSMILNIVIGFKQKDYEKAIFGSNGIAGLIFYASVCIAVVGTMMLDMKVMSAPFVIFLIVIPLICIFCRVPFAVAVKYKEFKLSEEEDDMTIGGFIVENFFEMFEYLLSYVSNTMSFLRVGGFVLSHAGMMLVVMTLMDGCGAIGKPFVFVIGTAFVMIMEGMIVAIQIIRLEFYEIFSRFYEGEGKPFEPVGVNFSSQTE